MRYIILIFVSVFFINYAYAQKTVLILDWIVNPDHAPIFVAQYKGFFKEEGLDIRVITPSDPADPPKWVAIGKADIGITYQPHYMIGVDKKIPIIAIGTLVATPLDTLITSPTVTKISDLKGKRIGYSESGGHFVMLRTMLHAHGLSLKDVHLINVRYALMQALLSGKVDGITGVGRNVELIQLLHQNNKLHAFYAEEEGVPPYNELIFVVNKKYINDPRWPKFMHAIEKGAQYLINHPEEVWEEFIKKYPQENTSSTREVWFATLRRFSLRPSAFDPKRWKNYQNFLFKNHLIRTKKPISSYIAIS